MKFGHKILKILQLNETIKPSQAYTERGSLETIVKNERQVAIITYNPDFLNILDRIHDIQYEIIPKNDSKHSNVVAYRRSYSQQAKKLINLIKQMDGYLCDCTPIQARILGTLLQYDPSEIESFVQRNYKDGKLNNGNYCVQTQPETVEQYCRDNFPEFYN